MGLHLANFLPNGKGPASGSIPEWPDSHARPTDERNRREKPMEPNIRKVQVLKHPNGKSPFWYLRWWEPTQDGSSWKERWRSTRTDVKKEADRKRRQLERELEAGKKSEGELQWDDFVNEFLEKHAARKPPTTLDFYERALRIFSETSKPKTLSQVKLITLEDFANARLESGLAPATVNRDLRHLRAALRWAKRRGLISDVPEFKSLFIKEVRKKPTIIPEEDFVAMIAALRKPDLCLTKRPAGWWRLFLYVAYYVGARRGEILSLSWDDVNFVTLEIRVEASTSKSRKERVVPMATDLAEVLKNWKSQTPSVNAADPVLPWPYDTYRQLYEDWHRIQTAAGIPEGAHYVPKNCRSTCASELIANQVPTVVVKDFLGHATVATTENYYINTKPAMRAAAQARKIRLESDQPKTNGDEIRSDPETDPKTEM